MAGPLKNSRHEKFCQLCASGIRPVDAYISLGYSDKGASPSATTLLKTPKISNRVKELKEQVAAYTVANVTFDRERVLNRLDILSRAAQEAGNFSAAIRAEELIGKERGMFVDRSISTVWNGDIAALSADQLAKLIPTFELLAAGENSRPAIDVQAEPANPA